MHTADVKKVLRSYSIDVSAREEGDLAEDPIVVRLRKVSGTDFSAWFYARFDIFVRLGALVTMVYELAVGLGLLFLVSFAIHDKFYSFLVVAWSGRIIIMLGMNVSPSEFNITSYWRLTEHVDHSSSWAHS